MSTPDFDNEMKKLKETEFEDLPLLINDMNTKAAAINYKRVLTGENKDIYYIPSSTDPINSVIEIKQIDDKEIDDIASRMKKYSR